ncbi:ribonuclease P protein subunit p30 isoform X2 [Orussus abietinus]|nr:ribonuclease P protein subunit p30 isoform X2 [Orussus abietinus]
MLTELYQLGYETVAINQTLDESVFNDGKRKKGQNTTNRFVVPEPVDIKNLVEEFKGKLTILNRITFIFSDPLRTHSLAQSSALKKYHLYAALPKSQDAFQFACSQLNADIIVINTPRSGLSINRKMYFRAIQRGLHFEIQYTHLINPDTRKVALYYSHLFHSVGKSKNVIITSGAHNKMQLRNPYDIINLAALLGLSETKAKASLHWQCRFLLLKAEGRRFGKAIFSIVPLKKRSLDNTEETTSPVTKKKKL